MSAQLTWFEALILGMVQGIAEFLPVSSSGHLVLSEHLLGLRPPGIALELTLHLGTLLAVVLYYRQDLWQMACGVVRFLTGKRTGEDRRAGDLLLLLVVGTIPAVIAALLFGDRVEAAFKDPRLVSGCLVVTGLLLLSTLLVRRGQGRPGPIDALCIGLFQAVSLLPGISRSGSTMAAGLFRKLKPEEAARFSFLLSIPAIAGAAAFKLKDLASGLAGANAGVYFLGFVVSFVFGWASIAVLLRIMRRGRFGLFGVYCVAVGVIGLVFLGSH
jgi:undecaprenyl-diphosphatase